MVTRRYGLQVMVNEEVDPALVIKRLKQEIRELKDEIRFVSSPCLLVAFVASCLYYAVRDELCQGLEQKRPGLKLVSKRRQLKTPYYPSVSIYVPACLIALIESQNAVVVVVANVHM